MQKWKSEKQEKGTGLVMASFKNCTRLFLLYIVSNSIVRVEREGLCSDGICGVGETPFVG